MFSIENKNVGGKIKTKNRKSRFSILRTLINFYLSRLLKTIVVTKKAEQAQGPKVYFRLDLLKSLFSKKYT